MSINDFLTKQNVNMIWEILLDEDVLKNKSKEIIIDVSDVVNKNIKGFYENEKKITNNLIDLNKKFITLIINYINKKYPSHVEPLQKQPIQSQEKSITYNDFQSERISQFEKDLTKRQSEFTNAMTSTVPQAPNFSDKLDEPMSEMETALKNVISQRNYDMEQVNKNLNTNQNDNWLKGTETSIKNEKLSILPSIKNNISNDKNINQNNNQDNRLKYIKIDSNPIENNILNKDMIDLNNNDQKKQKKHISWEDNNNNNNNNNNNININISELDTETDSFFNKLKILPTKKYTEDNNVYRINNLEIKMDDLIDKVDKICSALNIT
jgi:hypothetical protein